MDSSQIFQDSWFFNFGFLKDYRIIIFAFHGCWNVFGFTRTSDQIVLTGWWTIVLLDVGFSSALFKNLIKLFEKLRIDLPA
jgi:hypothetical protein